MNCIRTKVINLGIPCINWGVCIFLLVLSCSLNGLIDCGLLLGVWYPEFHRPTNKWNYTYNDQSSNGSLSIFIIESRETPMAKVWLSNQIFQRDFLDQATYNTQWSSVIFISIDKTMEITHQARWQPLNIESASGIRAQLQLVVGCL